MSIKIINEESVKELLVKFLIFLQRIYFKKVAY